VKGWNYPELLMTYDKAVRLSREEHVPVLIHVEDMTQPQGHSTSGSHERYKSPERLKWAEEFDCIAKFKEFLMLEGAVTEAELDDIRKQAKKKVRSAQKEAWADFRNDIDKEKLQAIAWLDEMISEFPSIGIQELKKDLESNSEVIRKEIAGAVRLALRLTRGEESGARSGMLSWYELNLKENNKRYSSHLYSESKNSVGKISAVAPVYPDQKEMVDGRLVLRNNFEVLFNKYPEIITFGEDTGKIGGVNQSMEGMQELFGETRVGDTGIREATILGQGIGLSMRGLRPIAEIQYLDYLYYALQIMRDDLATVQYRTKGGQKAPLIIRTRGHRLEGIWHSGSPMGAIISSVRGINVCVPRNMVQAAGMYNLLLEADEPALVIECLNGYRSKEALPSNLGEFKIALGYPEVVKEGSDITVVSYGSTFNLCEKAVAQLNEL
ncbi:MAG: thiamine pyrophosphate-dependent enzyme, partial [Flavobacteriales bacterium]